MTPPSSPQSHAAEPAGTEELAERLHAAAIRLLRRLRREDAALGIGPARASALSVLVFAGPMGLKDLAAAEQVSAPTMSRVVAGLEAAGLVRRDDDPRDARAVRLVPTARGRRRTEAGRRRRLAALAEAVAGLAARERERLAAALPALESLTSKPPPSRSRDAGLSRRR